MNDRRARRTDAMPPAKNKGRIGHVHGYAAKTSSK
jgi:hypothetical protein